MTISPSFLSLMESHDKLSAAVSQVSRILGDAQLIEAYGQVALEHAFSAPVIATMRATPGFEQAVKNFPESTLYDVIPEHRASPRQQMALEALNEASSERVDAISKASNAVYAGFADVLDHLADTVSDFGQQLQVARTSLANADIHNDLMATISVNTMSEEGFTKLLDMLTEYLGRVESFNVDHLRSEPDKIKAEIDELVDVVGDLGRVLGLDMDAYGIKMSDKDEAFVATHGTLAEKGITKEMLLFFVDKAIALCDSLKEVAEKKEELKEALCSEATNVPTALNSNDEVYGANEHETILCCYATLVSKMVKEGTIVIARILTTVDMAMDAKVAELNAQENPQTVSAD